MVCNCYLACIVSRTCIFFRTCNMYAKTWDIYLCAGPRLFSMTRNLYFVHFPGTWNIFWMTRNFHFVNISFQDLDWFSKLLCKNLPGKTIPGPEKTWYTKNRFQILGIICDLGIWGSGSMVWGLSGDPGFQRSGYTGIQDFGDLVIASIAFRPFACIKKGNKLEDHR